MKYVSEHFRDIRQVRRVRLLALLTGIFAMLFVAGCGSGGSDGAGGGMDSSSGSGSAQQMTEATGTGEPVVGVSAFEGIRAADEEASGWQDDAELYAIAAARPQLNAEGESPAWLYTYVSETSGAVASVLVEDGEASIDPPQELPEENIGEITDNLLPPPEEMLDSTEALSEAPEVVAVLEENIGIEAAAGLDSFSGGQPDWIFSTIDGTERVEQRVSAAVGGEDG